MLMVPSTRGFVKPGLGRPAVYYATTAAIGAVPPPPHNPVTGDLFIVSFTSSAAVSWGPFSGPWVALYNDNNNLVLYSFYNAASGYTTPTPGTLYYAVGIMHAYRGADPGSTFVTGESKPQATTGFSVQAPAGQPVGNNRTVMNLLMGSGLSPSTYPTISLAAATGFLDRGSAYNQGYDSSRGLYFTQIIDLQDAAGINGSRQSGCSLTNTSGPTGGGLVALTSVLPPIGG